MANTAYVQAIKVVDKVLSDGAYVSLALTQVDETQRKSSAPIVYGVLENYYLIDYTIRALCETPPKGLLKSVLFTSIFALTSSDMPAYAVVNESVEYTKKYVGEKQAKFINAVLNKVTKKDYQLQLSKDEELEVLYNLPIWIIKKLSKQYPKAYKKMMCKDRALHIRLKRDTSLDELKGDKVLKATKVGFYVEPSSNIERLFLEGKLTYQSPYSALAVLSLGDVYHKEVLDMCAAPGGKSVFIAERGGYVTSCDVHSHRVKLIEKYAQRMGVNVNTNVADGRVFNKQYEERFDAILVDAPCTGLGVIGKRQDMILRKDNGDVKALSRLQGALLDNAAKYLKKGGVLVYSTCTVLKEENADVVAGFLGRNKDFKRCPIDCLDFQNNGEVQFIKSDKFSEGFFIAKMVKK